MTSSDNENRILLLNENRILFLLTQKTKQKLLILEMTPKITLEIVNDT